MNTKDTKLYYEYNFANDFIKSLYGGINIELIKSESPDYLFKLGDETIGVEITELLLTDENNLGGTTSRKEGSWIQLINRCKILWRKYKYPNIEVELHFNNCYIPKGSINGIAEKIVSLVYNNIPEYGCDDIIEGALIPNNLVTYITSIFIANTIEYDECHWSGNDAEWTKLLKPKHIQSAINKKIEKYELYKSNCDYIWLLLIAYQFRLSSNYDLSDDIAKHTYKFPFDKVYIFQIVNKKIITLKNES